MNYLLILKLYITIVIFFCSSSLIANTIDIDEKNNNTITPLYQCLINEQTNANERNSAININPIKDAIYLEADTGIIVPQGVSTLNGNVIIQQNNTVFTASNAVCYD